MKIIKEIEKNRLSKDIMNELSGGESGSGNCSTTIAYSECSWKYEVVPCAVHLSCPQRYVYCTGTEASQKNICQTGYWEFK